MLFGYLHRHREVVDSFWWEINIYRLLLENRVLGIMVDFYNMQLERSEPRTTNIYNLNKLP